MKMYAHCISNDSRNNAATLLLILLFFATFGGCSCSREREQMSQAESKQDSLKTRTMEGQKQDSVETASEAGDSSEKLSPLSNKSELGNDGEAENASANEAADEASDGEVTNKKKTSRNSAKTGDPAAAGRTGAGDNGKASAAALTQAKSRSSGNGSSSKSTTPQQALSEAKALSVKAEAAGKAGEYSQAFSASLKAWEIVRAHPTDGECQQLAEELLIQIQNYGDKTNEKNNGSVERINRKPLKVE